MLGVALRPRSLPIDPHREAPEQLWPGDAFFPGAASLNRKLREKSGAFGAEMKKLEFFFYFLDFDFNI